MPRPGFVLEVDERTPPLLVSEGEGFRMQRFPLGTKVIYGPDPLPGLDDVSAQIRHALLHPVGDSKPLPELLNAGMKLTIAVDDISVPLPPMVTPDIRQRVLEQVIELAARAGVDDLEIVVATALHRRMTAAEIRRMVGERVFRSFWPKALYNLDAEDTANMTVVGQTDHGETVQIQTRAATSDLIVYVNINLVAMDGGHKSVAVGLAGYESLKHHHNVNTMLHSTSYMDPREGHSAINDSVVRMGRLLRDSGVKIFQIETTLNAETFPSQLGFLNRREWEWSVKDQAAMVATKKANDLSPPRMRREFFRRIEAPYKLTGINAGEVEAVHERTLENLHRQQLVEVDGQADVAIFGIPYLGPYNVNSVLNPILVHCLGLGYLFNLYRNKPIVREGGVAILVPPGAVGVQRDPPPELCRLLRGGARRDHRPQADRGDVRRALCAGPVVHPPVPDVARVSRRAPVLHVVLGGARPRPLR